MMYYMYNAPTNFTAAYNVYLQTVHVHVPGALDNTIYNLNHLLDATFVVSPIGLWITFVLYYI